MTVCDILPAAKSAQYSWVRLAAMSAGILLASIGVGGKAFAAVNCAPKAAHHANSTQCLAHHPRAGVHGGSKMEKTVMTNPAAEGDVLTPISATASFSKAIAAQPHGARAALGVNLPNVALPASALVARVGQAARRPSPWRGHGAPAGNLLPRAATDLPVARSAVTAATNNDGGSSFADLLHGGSGMPAVAAPAAWSVLLLGLLGLMALARSPRVARVQSWATASLSSAGRSAGRAKARGWAVDRVDPERYAQAQHRVARQGFVRAAAPTRFGS